MSLPDDVPPRREDTLPPSMSGVSPGQWVVIIVAAYLVRLLPWLLSEFWHDEIITLTDFAVGLPGRSPLQLFRTYPVANNHMLFSLVGWWWVRFLHFTSAEHLLRFPSAVCGLGVLGLVVYHWSRQLGRKVACAGGLLLAVSPVFAAFVYQFRGYGLTMLLAAVAWSGILEQRCGNWRRGTLLHAAAGALLVLTIPANALVVAAGLLTLLWRPPQTWSPSRRMLSILLPAAGTALGAIPYLLIADQFLAVVRQTSGWESGWSVLGNLALATLAHGGVFALFALAGTFRRPPPEPPQAENRPGSAPAPLWILACALLIVVPAVFLSRRAPYPRVFLGFLPMITYALLALSARLRAVRRATMPMLTVLVLANALLWEKGTASLTRKQVARGEHPQNLLQQYYRGLTDCRNLVTHMATNDIAAQAMVLTDAFDYPSFRYYWTQAGLPKEAVLADNRTPEMPWKRFGKPARRQLWAFAANETDAAELFAAAGEPGPFSLAVRGEARNLYLFQGG